ncbi:hypothetical protein LCGC14_0623960 [marine sediment metagenome]|uniref:Uncharacterized protein n=1 Tax=marine sediment metagenome TaxID=412755 RepID=A0A0F9UCG2_9ZZZZ
MAEILPPIKGIFKGSLTGHAPELTSEYMNNVRPVDVQEKRVRIGQRPGLDKWGNGTRIGATEQPVVAMISVNSVI